MHRVAYRVLGKPIFLGFRKVIKTILNVLTHTQTHTHKKNCDDDGERFF